MMPSRGLYIRTIIQLSIPRDLRCLATKRLGVSHCVTRTFLRHFRSSHKLPDFIRRSPSSLPILLHQVTLNTCAVQPSNWIAARYLAVREGVLHLHPHPRPQPHRHTQQLVTTSGSLQNNPASQKNVRLRKWTPCQRPSLALNQWPPSKCMSTISPSRWASWPACALFL